MFFKSQWTTRILALIVASIAWYALDLQLQPVLSAKGTALQDILIRYFSYFAIVTTFYAAVVTSYVVLRPARSAPDSSVLSSLMVYATMLALVYALMPQQLWVPSGPASASNRFLHYAVPFAYFVFWLGAVQKGRLTFGHPIGWLSFPVVYLMALIYLGSKSGFYPYAFFDANVLNRIQILINADIALAVFVAIGLVVVTIDRLLGRRNPEEEDG